MSKNMDRIDVGDVVELLRPYPCLDPAHKRGIVKSHLGTDTATGSKLWSIKIPRRFLLHNCKNDTINCNEKELKKVF